MSSSPIVVVVAGVGVGVGVGVVVVLGVLVLVVVVVVVVVVVAVVVQFGGSATLLSPPSINPLRALPGPSPCPGPKLHFEYVFLVKK